jgi:hypothetical protein
MSAKFIKNNLQKTIVFLKFGASFSQFHSHFFGVASFEKKYTLFYQSWKPFLCELEKLIVTISKIEKNLIFLILNTSFGQFDCVFVGVITSEIFLGWCSHIQTNS